MATEETTKDKSEQKSILILEDDRALLNAVEQQFTARGFRVLGVKNVQEGIAVMEKENVDVIWLDHYLLGKEDGLDFVIKLKNHDEWKRIPIFVISNSSGSQSIQSYVRLGVTQYYTKADYDLGQIIDDIEYTLKEGEQEEG